MHPSAHVDTFTRDSLPPKEEWPVLIFTLPELDYPARLNCVTEFLDRHIENGNGGRTALRTLEDSWSYDELQEKVNRIANLLVNSLGIVPGNRVLMRFPNNPLFAACYLAVMKCGAVAAPTMPLLRRGELETIIETGRIEHAICDTRLAGELPAEMLRQVVMSDELGNMMNAESADFDAVQTASDDVALIAFTSGTTGKPKGVLHFHCDVLSMCHTFCKQVLRPTPDDVFIGSPPLAFTFALGGLVAFPLYSGASTVLLESAMPLELAEAVEQTGATMCFTAPTAYKVILANGLSGKMSSLRTAVSAGEHLPKPVYLEWKERTGIPMLDGIGATELIHIFLSMTGEDDQPGSTGRPVPGYEVRIVDEALDELPAGEEGLLAVRGPTGCKYLADKRQLDYVRDGWNLTGDVFRRDEEGCFWYVARGDDMIISSGYNISGPEVEEALLGHSGVAECAVVAAPDEQRGNIPKAFIVLADSVEPSESLTKELQDFVKDSIAPYKYPRAIEYIAELPKTRTGKIQRYALRQDN